MSLNAQGYFNALRSYLNTKHYAVKETDGGGLVLKEKVFLPGNQEKVMKVRLVVPGEAIAINLDKKNTRGKADPLFHFLDDQAKPWSKRCDFVVFYRQREHLSVFCFEFKSASLPESLLNQLDAGEAWCRTVHSIIKHYTGESKRIYLTKYVLSCHPNPAAYLDADGKYLLRGPSTRHYLYQDIDGLSLDALDNQNVHIIS